MRMALSMTAEKSLEPVPVNWTKDGLVFDSSQSATLEKSASVIAKESKK